MLKITKTRIIIFVFIMEALLSLSFFNLYGATPQRPYYSETPNPRHIQNNDRLTAEYFNNQLNVIYNWAQRTHTELDNLLHNGLGVASLTVGILNCTNKILSPVLELEASSQPPSPPYNGMIYFDSNLQRFRVYQENAWRDLSSNYIIDGNTLTNPLIINGYLESSNLYVNENASITKNINVGGNASITKNLNVKGNIYSSGTAILKSLKVDKTFKVPTSASTTLGVGSIYYDATAGKLKAYNGSSWDIVGNDIVVDSTMSSTSTNPVQNKVIYTKFDNFEASTTEQLQQALLDAYAYANGIATLAYNYTDATATNTKNYADNAANNASNSAYTAAVNYANAQILVIDGRINTINTNLLASLTQGLTAANASSSLYASSAVDISEGYTQTVASNTIEYAQGLATQTLNAGYAYTDALRTYVDMAIATASNDVIASATKLFVSDVATGSNNTIAVTKNGSTTNISVGGAFAVPVGTVLPYFGKRYVSDPVPDGFLICDGSLVSKNDYPNLFAVVGYAFDDHQSGDYFALPDLRGRFLMGKSNIDVHASTVGKYVEPGLPNITGSIDMTGQTSQYVQAFGETISPVLTGAFSSSLANATKVSVEDGEPINNFCLNSIVFNASNSNSIYGNSDTVQPPALVCNYIIKY